LIVVLIFNLIDSIRFPKIAIFALADVRAAAREGIIENPEAIESLPVSTNAIIETFRANEEKLQTILKEADYAFLRRFSHNANDNDAADRSSAEDAEDEEDEDSDQKMTHGMLKTCTFNYFGDDNAENDCVYLIFKNPLKKRITVCFRGSITFQDWIKDSKVFVGDIPNPVSDRPNQPPTIGVHLGFREYLYGKSRKFSITQLGSIRPSFGSFYSTSTEDEPNAEAGTDRGIDESTTKTNPWNFKSLGSALSKLKETVGMTAAPENSRSVNTVPFAEDNDLNEEVLDANDIDNDKNSSDIEKDKKKDDDDDDNDDNNDDNNDDDNNDDNGNFDFFEMTQNTENSRESSATVHECRLDKILEEIECLRKENENYSVYITGHSLGGALGLLTALEAGARFGKPGKPVTYVGIANPRGGTVRTRTITV